MAKTNITGHGQDYCGTRYCKGELCGGPAKPKRSIYDLDLIGSVINPPVSNQLYIQTIPNNEEAKDSLAHLFERNEIAETLKHLSPKLKDALVADGDMKNKLHDISTHAKTSPKDLAEFYQFLIVKNQEGGNNLKKTTRIRQIEEKNVQCKPIAIISLDDGSKLFHVSQKKVNDLKVIENEIEDNQAIEMTNPEFWEELYFQSSPKTQGKIKDVLVERGLIHKEDGSEEIVDSLYNSWNDVNEENALEDSTAETLKAIQKKCPELTTARLAQIVAPIRERDILSGFADDGEDHKAVLGYKPINWLFTDAFEK